MNYISCSMYSDGTILVLIYIHTHNYTVWALDWSKVCACKFGNFLIFFSKISTHVRYVFRQFYFCEIKLIVSSMLFFAYWIILWMLI